VAEGKQEVPANVEKPQAPAEPMRRTEKNVVLIGVKPIMNYVIACVTVFNARGNDVCLKARGRAISRAVDTVELLRRAFVKDLAIKEIKIGTEEIMREEGRRSNVSTIEITLAKTA
jgi:DNA-binding protein